MYGHWKMVATLGLAEDHNRISRRAVDRIIAAYAAEPAAPRNWPTAWRREDWVFRSENLAPAMDDLFAR